MRTFDANCTLGRSNHWSGKEPIAPEDLLVTMNHYGIHDALVVDSLSRESHPAEGNERILKLVAGQPRLHPAWVALPPRSRELPAPADFVAEMAERGVRALFLYPQQYGFSLEPWCVDALLGPLAERHVPVFLCPNQSVGGPEAPDLTDWRGVVRLCGAFPKLPVVVTEARILRTQRTMYQALEACPNLHVELSALWHHRTVEFFCREFGARRLLFGSGLPARDPGAVLGQMNYSEIAPEDLAAIAGGNLRGLLSWHTTPLPQPAVRFPKPLDELHKIARNRASLRGQRLVCGHGHLGLHPRVHVPDGSPADLVAEMDRLGVEKAIIFPNGGMNSDEIFGNDMVAEAVRQYPDRFVGFVLPNLNRTAEAMRREMARGFALGLKGVKMHPALQGYDTRGPNVEVACAFANERKALIVNHDWGHADRMRSLCLKYPDACFMTGHTSLEAAGLVKECPNLFIGTCPLTTYGVTEELVGRAGADRILFTSDLSWAPMGWVFGPVLYARIPVEAKRLILGGNLRRLLQQYRQ
jgi:predicted TIM-barrel fold metal-dependent hydrolase